MIKRKKKNPEIRPFININKMPRNWIASFNIYEVTLPKKGDLKNWKAVYNVGDSLKLKLSIYKEKKNYYIYTIEAFLFTQKSIIYQNLESSYFDSIYIEHKDDDPGNDRVWYLVEEFNKKYSDIKLINKIIKEMREYEN